MKNVINKNNGITLIALIITIIILIILAGIAISSISGDNGLIARAREAKYETEKAQLLEELKVETMATINNKGICDLKKCRENFINNLNIPEENIKTSGEDSLIVSQNGTMFEITKYGEVSIYNVLDKLKIGDYVNYDVPYEDIFVDYTYTNQNAWRVLDPNGIDNDGVEVVKLVSTGIPVELYYSHTNIRSAQWAGTREQIDAYAEKFYPHNKESNDFDCMYAVAGLYYNFDKLSLNSMEESRIRNYGRIKNVNGIKTNTTGKIFLRDSATEVHMLTVSELNKARNDKNGQVIYDIIKKEGGNFAEKVTTENDAADGLFNLKDLSFVKYGDDMNYWLASPSTTEGDGSMIYQQIWRKFRLAMGLVFWNETSSMHT